MPKNSKMKWVMVAVAGMVVLAGVAGWAKGSGREEIAGLIIPHHDLARELALPAVQKIASQRGVKKIVLLSPNHWRPKSDTFVSTPKLLNFKTDQTGVNNLAELGVAVTMDETLLNGEHGLYVPAEYLRQAWPEAAILPIAIAPYFTPEKLDRMARALVEAYGRNALYVAAVDFAHDQMQLAGREKNLESIKTITSFDYPTLWTYKDDHMDSPAAIGLLMKIMELLGAKNWETWESAHAAEILGQPMTQGTSYVIGVFR